MRAILCRAILALAVLVGGIVPAAGEEVVARLSQTSVSITTDFAGSEIVVYGAVRREAPAPEGQLHLIVAITGPSTPVVLRKRERRWGVWVNGPPVQIDAAPSLYAVASTGPLDQILSHTDNLRHRIGLDEVIRLIDAPDWLVEERGDYREAVMRLRRDEGLYFTVSEGVMLDEDTLFQTAVPLPANLVAGEYRARIFLLRDRTVIDVHETAIAVQKVGLERVLYEMATEQEALYGVASILLALASGWLASAMFRWLMP
ncbi:MAG: TIGR02186 family protein [Pseudomonadota bacterium]